MKNWDGTLFDDGYGLKDIHGNIFSIGEPEEIIEYFMDVLDDIDWKVWKYVTLFCSLDLFWFVWHYVTEESGGRGKRVSDLVSGREKKKNLVLQLK